MIGQGRGLAGGEGGGYLLLSGFRDHLRARRSAFATPRTHSDKWPSKRRSQRRSARSIERISVCGLSGNPKKPASPAEQANKGSEGFTA
jgi:hypothetical protein